MRSLILLAALSTASFAAAQDSPEAPPLHPPEPDDDSSASTSSTTTTTTTTSTTSTAVETKKEAESSKPPPPEPTTAKETTTGYVEPSSTVIEPEVPKTAEETLLPDGTEATSSNFITVHTTTPGHSNPSNGSATETGSPPVVTGGARSVAPRWSGWAFGLSFAAGLTML